MRNLGLTSGLMALALCGTAMAAVPADPIVERIAPDRLRVTWRDAAGVDVYRADRPDATLGQSQLVSSDDRDGRHEMIVAPGERTYFLLRDHGGGQSVRVAERLLPLEHGSNFRDVGGYPAAGGKHVRWGLIYRSGATPVLTAQDLKTIEGLHLASLVDLRSSDERRMAPTKIDGVPYTAIGYPMGTLLDAAVKAAKEGHGADAAAMLYREMPISLAPHFRILFRRLLDHDGAVAFNCSAGQDRTGLATALVLSALGVPRDVIIADYHLSTGYRRPEFEVVPTGGQNPLPNAASKPQPLKTADGKAFLSFAFESIDQRYGSVENYLDKVLGVDALAIATLRRYYLE